MANCQVYVHIIGMVELLLSAGAQRDCLDANGNMPRKNTPPLPLQFSYVCLLYKEVGTDTVRYIGKYLLYRTVDILCSLKYRYRTGTLVSVLGTYGRYWYHLKSRFSGGVRI